jgi:hypothetical protein
MKHINLTKSVMNRVVNFEAERVTRFRTGFKVVMISLLSILFLTGLFIFRQMQQENIFDLLVLFSEDKEIISEFWQDTVVTFWEELPQLYILTGLVVLLVIIGVIIFTRQIRRVNRQKLSEINKYHL